MAQIEVILPKMGESVAEATITEWLKEEGDSVEIEESIVEIATDKVDSEVPAPEAGVLVKKNCAKDDVVKVGEVIAIISTEGEEPDSSSDSGGASQEEKTEKPSEEVEEYAEKAMEPLQASSGASNGNGKDLPKSGAQGQFFSPLVRSIASKENVSKNELEQIEGSGQNGRVTKKDILSYVQGDRKTAPATNGQSSPAQKSQKESRPAEKAASGGVQINQPEVVANPEDEIIEMDRMRKMISDHMVMSKHVSPHVTSYVEADVTKVVKWREKVKKDFQSREGEKITYTPIFIEAIVKALKDFPMVNVSVKGDNQIIKRKNINIGMATAMPSGHLIVPVIRKADQLNMTGLTKQVNDLATRARDNKLDPDEIGGGTFTVTNVGTFGNVMGTPIINQPQVAIMALGAIRKVPAVIETPDGDFIGIRHKMYLSHSYDHRVVDGALGGMFVKRVADYIEAFDEDREL